MVSEQEVYAGWTQWCQEGRTVPGRAVGTQSHHQVGRRPLRCDGDEAHRGWAPPAQRRVPRIPAEAEALPILVAS